MLRRLLELLRLRRRPAAPHATVSYGALQALARVKAEANRNPADFVQRHGWLPAEFLPEKGR